MTTTGGDARIPRRWNVEIDGIRWLPRMIDKARMSLDGMLGAYLLGHSPVDRSLLPKLGVTTDEFTAIVHENATDAGVLAALRARGFDEAKTRAWSDAFTTRFKSFIPLWDLDEGYLAPSPAQKVGLALFKPLEGPLMGLVRKIRPAP